MTDSVCVAYLHPGEVSHSFHESMRNMMLHDLAHQGHVVGVIAEECGAARISDGRNSATRKFLATDADWLLMVDADMGWEADALDRLLEAADPTERPIVGGLCFAQRKGPATEAGARHTTSIPTVFRWYDDGNVAGCAPIHDYPDSALVECGATGAAFLLVHRTVFEKSAGPPPREWFGEIIHRGQVFGEDIAFCRRAVQAGFKIYVHTGVKTSHYKHVYLDERTTPSTGDIPNFVVVPAKDRLDLTESLLRQLEEQGGYRNIFLLDNGSTQDTKDRLVNLDIAGLEVFDAAGLNIHEMWNRGIDEAISRAWPCNIAVLNNDLNLGDGFLTGLASALRSDAAIGVVGPNYDGRDGEPLQLVTEICAGRYDGTGGLPGFAFMMKGESGYRFPEELHWWFGDNDMILNVLAAGSVAAIVRDVTVEHVGGGSQTADWDDPDMRRVLDADRAWFQAKWAPAEPETHLVVLWSGCDQTDRILADVGERFEVVERWTHSWDDFVSRLSGFYDTDGSHKAAQCGDGPFTVAVVVDHHPVYGERDTTRGRRSVNTNLFDAKQQWRSWVSNPETVHASDTVEDARANLAHLTGFDTLADVFAAIPCRYVVLRNFDNLPDDHRVDDHGDVDLLVEDLDATVKALNAAKVHPEPHRVQYAVPVGGEWVPFDLRHVGDGYFDEQWQRHVLDTRKNGDGFYRPNRNDHYWTLLYHALCHKGTVGPYEPVLEGLRPGGPHTREALDAYLAEHGFDATVPNDLTVPLIT